MHVPSHLNDEAFLLQNQENLKEKAVVRAIVVFEVVVVIIVRTAPNHMAKLGHELVQLREAERLSDATRGLQNVQFVKI